jgi:hypothetical protein
MSLDLCEKSPNFLLGSGAALASTMTVHGTGALDSGGRQLASLLFNTQEICQPGFWNEL